MPPRKYALAAGEDGRIPPLKLTMVKGPLSGQSNVFDPGSRVNIGRVVRGNTIAIKDDGISSKHFVIQVESMSEKGIPSWTIADLGSSNGTFLNGEQLEPSEPAVLSDGDVIKVGEKTSIEVKFEVNVGKDEVSSGNVRRNARRGVRNKVPELGVIDEDSELGLGLGDRNEKCEGLGNGAGKLEIVDKGKGRGKRARGAVLGESENLGEQVEVKVGNLGKASVRATRSSKKEQNLESSRINLNEDEEVSDEVSEVEVKQGRNANSRATRSSKNNQNMREVLSTKVSVRRTRSSRKEEEDINEIGIDLDVTEGKRNRRGARGRKKLPVEVPLEEESNLEDKECEKEEEEELDGDDKLDERVSSGNEGDAEKEEEKLDGDDKLDERVSSGNEGDAGLASTSGVKENGVDFGKGATLADLEKMTLGEWFDFLEVFLPKQIIDETEKKISEMRQKSERLQEFMLQQKNAKKNGELTEV